MFSEHFILFVFYSRRKNTFFLFYHTQILEIGTTDGEFGKFLTLYLFPPLPSFIPVTNAVYMIHIKIQNFTVRP